MARPHVVRTTWAAVSTVSTTARITSMLGCVRASSASGLRREGGRRRWRVSVRRGREAHAIHPPLHHVQLLQPSRQPHAARDAFQHRRRGHQRHPRSRAQASHLLGACHASDPATNDHHVHWRLGLRTHHWGSRLANKNCAAWWLAPKGQGRSVAGDLAGGRRRRTAAFPCLPECDETPDKHPRNDDRVPPAAISKQNNRQGWGKRAPIRISSQSETRASQLHCCAEAPAVAAE